MAPRKILVVDDEPDILDLISVFLKRRGHCVMSASSGAEGMSLLQVEAPHLLLTDKRLPDCLGYELIERSRAQGGGSRIKTVLITGDEANGRSAGYGVPDGILLKPFALHELGDLVDRLLG